MTFGSLFSGIGGLDLGLERAGMTCQWQVEIDEYAERVLEKHWPDVRRWKDITTFPPEGDWSVDLICGGFPCQDISFAGKGAGLHGVRSGLFFEAIRVVETVRPRWVLLENVAALLVRGLPEVLGTLASIGFDAEWHCIPAAAVGAPHIRDRVFILAYSNSNREIRSKSKQAKRDSGSNRCGEAEVLANTTMERCTEAGEHERNEPTANREHILSDAAGIRRKKGHDGPRQDGQQEQEEQRWMQQPSRVDWWITEPAVGRVADGVPDRVDRLRCLGNAVVPQVAEFIGRQIIRRECGEA